MSCHRLHTHPMEYPCYTRALPHSCHAMPHPAMPTLPCYPCRAILMTCCSSPMPCHAAPHTHAMPCPCHVTPVPCNAHIIPMAWHASCKQLQDESLLNLSYPKHKCVVEQNHPLSDLAVFSGQVLSLLSFCVFFRIFRSRSFQKKSGRV